MMPAEAVAADTATHCLTPWSKDSKILLKLIRVSFRKKLQTGMETIDQNPAKGGLHCTISSKYTKTTKGSKRWPLAINVFLISGTAASCCCLRGSFAARRSTIINTAK